MTTKRKILCLLMLVIFAFVCIFAVGCKKEDPTPQAPAKTEWPEAGVYYFDAGNDECTLTLNVGDTFSLYVKGEHQSGSYTLKDGIFDFDFTAEGKENLSASLENNVISLTYNGAFMRFLKKVNYTVNFETNGGNSMDNVTVVNGKTVAKPADPVRDGYIFVGWYADSAFKTPFAFGAQPVTSNTTIYAQWSEDATEGVEYTVKFDLNYDGAATPASVTTIGGKLFGIEEPSREGYTFAGWWISMERDGDKLSYQYAEDSVFEADTTLYALWIEKTTGGKLTAPIVRVEAGSISWSAIEGARSYDVKVINSDGEAVVDETTSSTTINVPFATYAAGEYEIRVTANANSGEANNSESVRYYVNKALKAVWQFDVVGNILVFNTVENAEKYLITVECGNSDHNHTNFDNGTSRTFSFANCDMADDGIKFTVTAIAEGYASSTSETFVYKKDLAAVKGFTFNAATETVSWNEVADAAYYMVSVECGNAEHNHAFFNNGTKTSVSLKECSALAGGIVVKVYPVAKGFNSPAAAEYTYNKTALAAPSNLAIDGTLLTWNADENAAGYEVDVNGRVYTVESNSFDLAAVLNGVEGSEYTVSVRATGDKQSLWSDALKAVYYEMNTLLSYSQSVLTWTPVIGAEHYEVQVNGGEIISFSGVNSAEVALTKAGVNLLKVRFVDGANSSDWAEIEVFAHAVTFDTLGGSAVDVQYKAVGDRITLPTPTKTGYTFVDWYNVPGGAASNGLAYTEELFTESGAIVLYAFYNAEQYDIVYNYGLDGTGDKESDKVSYEQNYQLLVPVANSPAGAFGGWFSAPYGMGTQYTDANGNSLAPWNTTEGAELYAFWIDEALQFTLTKVNGKEGYAVSAGPRIDLVTEVKIPATYNGLPVLMVSGNAFMNCTTLKVINLPATIEQISLIDPFTGCTSLVEVNIYDVAGVAGARYSSKDGVLFDNGSSASAAAKLLYVPVGKTGTYRIPAGITEIAEETFKGSALSKIYIPASVTTIGNDAFANCAKLTSVVFEAAAAGETEKALTIGKRAFSGCSMLEKITLPARLTDIALGKYTISAENVVTENVDNAFANCSSLETIAVAANSKTYKAVDGVLYSADGRTLYYCPATKAESFTIPTGVQTIAPGAFVGCSMLNEITISNTVTYVGECAFYGLNITKVTFLGNGFNDVTVGTYAFRGCDELEEVVTEGSRLAALNEGAFYGCDSLTEFNVPAFMTNVGAEAFRDCTALEVVNFADSDRALVFGENAFYNCSSLASITLPANVSEIPGIFSGCTALAEVNVSEDSQYFTSIDGVLFNKAESEVLYFPRAKTGEYALPTTVTVVANGVFRGADLDKVTIPSTVSYIGEDAFRDSSIDVIVFEGDALADSLVIGKSAFESATFGTLTLPASTTSIGTYAFAYTNYDSIVLNEGLTVIPDYAFYAAKGNNAIKLPASVTSIGTYSFSGLNLGTYWSPNLCFPSVEFATENSQLEIIGLNAFRDNPMQSITIPASVKVIDNYAFYDCEELDSIVFEENSQLTTIGAYAFAFTSSYSASDIETITLPAKLAVVGAYAFKNSSLQTVVFLDGAADAADLVLGEAVGTYTVDYGSGQYGGVFYNCQYLESVTLPSHLVEIKDSCFYYAGYYSSNGLTVKFAENGRLAVIGPKAFYWAKLIELTLPGTLHNLPPVVDENGVSHDRLAIGAEAFYGSYRKTLTSVTFLNGSQPMTIGASAFYSSAITSITLPSNLAPYTSYTGEVLPGVGLNAFESSTSLTAINVAENGQHYVSVDGVLYNADMTELLLCPAGRTEKVTVPATVTKVNERAFYCCESLTEVEFVGGSNDLTIGNSAFEECSSLVNIVLPSNLVSIGDRVFYRCDALESVTLSKNLKNFDGSMLEQCTSLQNVFVEEGNPYFCSDNGVLYNADKTALIYYPVNRTDESYTVLSGVVSIEAYAFKGVKNLKTVVLPTGLREINDFAFNGSKLVNVEIPNTVELIGHNAFGNNYSLTNVTFEMGGTAAMVLGKQAFYSSAVTTLVLPARVAVIGEQAFYYGSIQTLTFESGESKLTEVSDLAFTNSSLVSVVFPAGLVSVGADAFYNCYDLESVVFGEGLVSIGEQAFYKTGITSIVLPASLKELGVEAFSKCTALTEVIFTPGCQIDKLANGMFYDCSSLESIIIPASVKEIEDKGYYGVFQNCSSLTSVEFESGSKLTKIGSNAFYYCSALTEFDVPATVSTVGEYAFYYCENLERVSIPSATTQLGTSLFYGCAKLAEVDLKSGASELPSYMFYNCASLESIVIPANVSIIGNSCFVGSGISSFGVDPSSQYLTAVEGILYSADRSAIVLYPPMKTDAVITIPKEVTNIAPNTFANMNSLKEVVFEDGGSAPLVIGEKAFAYCYNLYSVTLPERLITIGEYAFSSCYNLTNITIPSSVTTIEDAAFYSCPKLVEVYNKSQLEIVAGAYDEMGFAGYYALNVYTPDSGESTLNVDDNGFVTVTYEGLVYLLGYRGNDADITLPEVDGIYDYAFYRNKTISSIVVPEGVGREYLGQSVFTYAENITILLFGDETISENWSSYGLPNCQKIWGWDGTEHTYTFHTNTDEVINPITSAYAISIPEELAPNGDMIFCGWYDNAEFTGAPYSGSYYSATKTDLYARWMTLDEYYAGSNFEYAIELELGESYFVNIDESYEKVYFVFTATESGKYLFSSTADSRLDSVGEIYNSNQSKLAEEDYSLEGDYYLFDLIYELEAGETYYFVAKLYSSYTGQFYVSLTQYEE